MNKKIFGSVKNFSGCLKNLNFKTTLKPHEMAPYQIRGNEIFPNNIKVNDFLQEFEIPTLFSERRKSCDFRIL